MRDQKIIISEDQVFVTTKEDIVYLICTAWPEDKITIGGIVKQISNLELIGYSNKIEWTQEYNDLTITPPLMKISEIPCQHAWVFKIEL